MSTITDFLAQPTDTGDEPELEQQVPTDLPPLVAFTKSPHLASIVENPHMASIADSLRALVKIFSGQAADEHESDLLRQHADDLGSKLEAAYSLVTEIEAIIKPSTSKLANAVRTAIGRHLGREGFGEQPELEPEQTDEPVVEPGEPQQPAADAPIEVWVAFAQAKGLDIDPGRTNRSQIRTALGLPHFEG